MDCPPIPQFCLDFLLRSKTYLRECPPGTSIANRDFSSLANLRMWLIQNFAGYLSEARGMLSSCGEDHHGNASLNLVTTAPNLIRALHNPFRRPQL